MWQYRCRFIEPDDLRGAIRLYGGHVRKQPRFCDVYPAPKPPTDLKLDSGTGGQPKLSWRNPPMPRVARPEFKKPVIQATAGVSQGDCSSRSLLDLSGISVDIIPGNNQQLAVDRAERPGTWCYTLRLVDEFGRESHAGIAVTIPNALPTVLFTAQTGFGDGNCVEMSDSSVDPDGQIVAWQWDFGAPGDSDNSSADPGYAGHCYQQPGTYTITLTITDDSGGRASGAQTVTIG
jgi:hypothetical protein